MAVQSAPWHRRYCQHHEDDLLHLAYDQGAVQCTAVKMRGSSDGKRSVVELPDMEAGDANCLEICSLVLLRG